MWKSTGIGFMACPPPGYDSEAERAGAAACQGRPAPTKPPPRRRPVRWTDLPGLGRLDHRAGTHVHGDVLGAPGAVEEEVARLQVAERHGGRVAHLGARVVGKADAHLAPGPGGQARAVESRVRRALGGLGRPRRRERRSGSRRPAPLPPRRARSAAGRRRRARTTCSAAELAELDGRCGLAPAAAAWRASRHLGCRRRRFCVLLLLDELRDLAVLLGQGTSADLNLLGVLRYCVLLGGHAPVRPAPAGPRVAPAGR